VTTGVLKHKTDERGRIQDSRREYEKQFLRFIKW